MNVATLQQFLRSLVPALQAADAGPRAAQDLGRACRGLEPFGSLDLDAFAGFLARCEEFQRTGAVPSDFDLAAVQEPLRRLGAALRRIEAGGEPGGKDDLAAAQRQLGEGLTGLAKAAGLTGNLKADAKWAGKQADRARVLGHARAVRELAARLDGPTGYDR